MKKISNNEYRDLVNRWQESGKSKASFAEAEGISRTTFYYWCKKFSLKKPASIVQSSFSAITPDLDFQREAAVRISYPSGVSIEFFGKVDVESIKKLV